MGIGKGARQDSRKDSDADRKKNPNLLRDEDPNKDPSSVVREDVEKDLGKYPAKDLLWRVT